MLASAIVGHRGLASLAPENTLASIRMAHLFGIRWVELDASLLGDGSVVLCHDDSWDRCSNHSGLLCHSTAADLQLIDAGGWFSERFRHEPVPTLQQALTLLSELGMGLNLELKAQTGIEHSLVIQQILPIIKNYWCSNLPILISSFDHELLHQYRLADKHQLLGTLYETIDNDWLNTQKQLCAVSLHCDWNLLNQAQATGIIAAGYDLLVYTCNKQRDAQTLWNMGVHSIISDTPHLLSPH